MSDHIFTPDVEFTNDTFLVIGETVYDEFTQEREFVPRVDNYIQLPNATASLYDYDNRRWFNLLKISEHFQNARIFKVINLEKTLGKYYSSFISLVDNSSLPVYYNNDYYDGYFTLLKYNSFDEIKKAGWSGFPYEEHVGTKTLDYLGDIQLKFHPPIEHELRELAEHIFSQDIPLISAVSGLIKQQRKLTAQANHALIKVAEGMEAISQNNSNKNALLSNNAAYLRTTAEDINCTLEDCWGNAEYLQDVLTVWDAAHANLLAQEKEQLDRGEFPDDLNWREALHDAIESTKTHYPSVHHDYHLNDDTSLFSFTLGWQKETLFGTVKFTENVENKYILVLSDTEHDADIPGGITDFTLNATPNDAAATVYVNDSMTRLPITVTAPGDAFETEVKVDVVAQNQLEKTTHTIILRRPHLNPDNPPGYGPGQ